VGRLIQFLIEHPILLFVLAAWLFGGIGKIGKAAQRARSAAGPQAKGAAGQRSAEEVAAEMRRILGMDDARTASSREMPEPLTEVEPDPEMARPAPRLARREVVAPERPPAPLGSAFSRRLPTPGTSHVGESIERRQTPASGRVGQAADFGGLGGRVTAGQRLRRADARLVDVVDLKRALVMNEVLGPPLALRETFPG
jgi:hypothetical protein